MGGWVGRGIGQGRGRGKGVEASDAPYASVVAQTAAGQGPQTGPPPGPAPPPGNGSQSTATTRRSGPPSATFTHTPDTRRRVCTHGAPAGQHLYELQRRWRGLAGHPVCTQTGPVQGVSGAGSCAAALHHALHSAMPARPALGARPHGLPQTQTRRPASSHCTCGARSAVRRSPTWAPPGSDGGDGARTRTCTHMDSNTLTHTRHTKASGVHATTGRVGLSLCARAHFGCAERGPA